MVRIGVVIEPINIFVHFTLPYPKTLGKSFTIETGYVLMVKETTFSWKSIKQTITTTSSNHVEILALHELSQS